MPMTAQAPTDRAHVKLKVLQGVPSDVREHYDFGPERQGKILGKGQFGTVRQATHRKTGEQVAVKSIAKRKLLTQEEVDDVRRWAGDAASGTIIFLVDCLLCKNCMHLLSQHCLHLLSRHCIIAFPALHRRHCPAVVHDC